MKKEKKYQWHWAYPDATYTYVHHKASILAWLTAIYVVFTINNPVGIGNWAGQIVRTFRIVTAI